MLTLNEFAVRHIFNRVRDLDGEPIYWIPVDEGYLIVYNDGESHHTHHNPENVLGWTEWEWELDV